MASFHQILMEMFLFCFCLRLPLGVATITILITLLLLCVSCLFPCNPPLSFLLWKDGLGIFNVRNDLSACCVHEGETGTDEFAQMLTRENWKGSFTLPRPGLEPTVAAVTRPLAQPANHCATASVLFSDYLILLKNTTRKRVAGMSKFSFFFFIVRLLKGVKIVC